ncbi:hypothetical protein HHL24_17125 [Paraburkholderia sp. RP-4-7]|uniref:Uncharacterized protein n=1 Tax=Paraburkholderia polaris TaxID=2728848 RepID=A0A848IBI2_9BURK|nr:hypothetical protein [Paraburkholderia polaris]NML99651.1 hypothetical protein [Paraburkholderia polaris]
MKKRNPEAIVPADPPATVRTPEQAKLRSERLARITVSGQLASTQLMSMFVPPLATESIPIGELAEALRGLTGQVTAGDMSGVEVLLVSQAVALNTLFGEFAHRASVNLGTHLGATESYMRLALKCQQQSASTLRTLGDIKNPRAPVSFVKQANITSGNQQINNHGTAPTATSTHAHTRTGEKPVPTNELLEHQDGERLDTGAASGSSRGDQTMAAVGAVHRTGD